jgi:hypothetical protein
MLITRSCHIHVKEIALCLQQIEVVGRPAREAISTEVQVDARYDGKVIALPVVSASKTKEFQNELCTYPNAVSRKGFNRMSNSFMFAHDPLNFDNRGVYHVTTREACSD